MQLGRQLASCAAVGALLLLGSADSALAHAELVGSEPADAAQLQRAPERVRLFFSEPIEPEFFALQVYAPDRSRIDRGDARISPADARVLEAGLREASAGAYTVVWRALSLDGHVVRGSFAFSLGAAVGPARPLQLDLPAEGAPFPLEAAVRWLTFLFAFTLLGGFAFQPLVFGPAVRAVALEQTGLEQMLAARWLRLAWLAVALLLGVSFVALLFQASSAAGAPLGEVLGGRAVTRLLTATRYGVMWTARLVLLIAVVGVLAWLSAMPRSGPARWWAGATLAAAVLLTLSASGHASTAQGPTELAVLADWAHLLAGGLWVGGLIHLGLTLPAVLRAADPDGRRRLLGCLAPRFSWLAGLSVATLAITGLYSGLLWVPSWNALLNTSYGAALSGKLLLVGPLLALGAINLLVMSPRFRHAAQSAPAGRHDERGRRVFQLLVLGEVALAASVLGVTGVLTGLAPASALPLEGRPFLQANSLGSLAAEFQVSPNQPGENRLSVRLTDPQGRPVADARVQLSLRMLEMDMGTRQVEVTAEGPGRYAAGGSHLSMPGRWQANVRLQRPDSFEETTEFVFTVGQAPGANRPSLSPAYILVLLVQDPDREKSLVGVNLRFVAALVALAAAAVHLALTRLVLSRGRARRAGHVLAAAFLAVGVGLGAVSIGEAYRKSLPNPVPADAASRIRGQQVYEVSCVACHGVSGRGDGPLGRTLRPRPADFRVHMAAGHTDRQLFDWISHGIEATSMPAFHDQLSEQEHWDVINYVRGFAG